MSKFNRRLWQYDLKLEYFENSEYVDLEDLYQAFRVRLIAEIAASCPEILEGAIKHPEKYTKEGFGEW